MVTIPSATSRLIPRQPSTIDRPRLLEQLGAGSHRLVLVTAPPGYGKTTLVAQYAHQSELTVVWHTINERQRDVSRLYEHSLLVCEATLPGFRKGLPAAGEMSAEDLAAIVAERLHRTHPGSMLYVLDDLHLLDGVDAAERWLDAFMKTVPDTYQLVLVSRTIPALTYIEMVVRQEIQIVNQQHLRMQDEEAIRLARSLHSEAPPDSDVHDLVRRLEGWPAGLALALQPHAGGFSGQVIGIQGEGAEAVFWTLANAIFQEQPPDLQRFLLASSVPAILTPEICSSALSLRNVADWLETLQSRNLFLSHVAGGLTYHSLFREYLQHKLQQENPDRFADLHASAARWFESRNDLDNAFNHLLLAGRVRDAVQLAERVAVAWFGEGRFQTLLAWCERLKRIGEPAPTLLYMGALVHTSQYEFKAAVEKLDQAEQVYAQQANQEGLDECQIQRATIHMLRGEHERAIQLAQPLTDRPTSSLRGRALRIIGAAHMNRGQMQTSLGYLEEAARLIREAGLVSSLAALLQDLQHTYTRLGRLEEAGACLQEVVALHRRLGGTGGLAMALNNLGYYYFQLGDYALAQTTLEDGLNLVAGLPNRRAEAYLLCSLGDLKRDLDLHSEAETLYERAIKQLVEQAEPGLRSFILTSLATLRRRQGRQTDALVLADKACEIARANGNEFEEALALAAGWLARAMQEPRPAAFRELDGVLEQLLTMGARFEFVGVCAACADIQIRHDNLTGAETYLVQALAAAGEIGTAQPLAAEVGSQEIVRELLADHDGLPLAMTHIKLLQEARADRGDPGLSDGFRDGPTISLTVYTLGQETVERDGKEIATSEWQAAAPKELFLYLLFNGPQTKDAIGLVFWPESDGEQVRNLFHTTLSRARQALGKNAILYEGARYRLNPNLSIWCDALEVEHMEARAEAIPNHNAQAEDLWRRVTMLYQGDFLPEIDSGWATARREKLRESFLKALFRLGQCAYARQDKAQAIALYRQALEEDPYREAIYREILRCYAELGQPRQVQDQWEGLLQLFRLDLGTEPSPELRGFYESLLI